MGTSETIEQIFTFLTRQIWTAFLGGFYFDKHLTLLQNTIHFYVYLFLLLFPLAISSSLTFYTGRIVYIVTIGVFFVIVKLINFRFHQIFDKEQKEQKENKEKKEKEKEEQEKEKEKNIEVIPQVQKEDDTVLKGEEGEEIKTPTNQEKSDSSNIRSSQTKKSPSNPQIKTIKKENEEDGSSETSVTPILSKKSKTSTTKEEEEEEFSTDAYSLKEESESEGVLDDGKGISSQKKEPKIPSPSQQAGNQTTSFSIPMPSTSTQPELSILDDPRNYETNEMWFLEEPSTFTESRDAYQDNFHNFQESVPRTQPNPKPPKPPSPPEKPPQIKIFTKYYDIPFRRLFLLELIDKDDSIFEIILTIILVGLTSLIAYQLIQFYYDFAYFMLCLIVAGVHYSLLKSPQPDASSPRSDENKFNRYNRSFYFILIGSVILLLDNYLQLNNSSFTLYAFTINFTLALQWFEAILIAFLPYFPLVFTLGLFPQCNTFIMFVFEAINRYVFGSSGTSTFIGVFIDTFRTVLVGSIVFGLGYASKLEYGPIYSLYLALLVGLCFLHSRFVNDPSLYPALSDLHIRRKKNSMQSERLDISNYPFYRLKLDFGISLLAMVLVFVIHISTVLDKVYINGLYVVAAIASFAGFIIRFFIPTMRKPHPFKIFISPFFETTEHRVFEPPNRPAKITWFEKVFWAISFLEVAFFYPVIFLIAFAGEGPLFVQKFGLNGGVIVITIIGIKCFRGLFVDVSKNYLYLLFTLFFFTFDYRIYSENFLIDYFISTIIVEKLNELYLKINFVVIYIAPWNLSWGSAVHAILQPLSIPHTTLALFQTVLSTLITSPLYPFVGSTVFLTSYGRTVKYWERSYKTNRIDNTQIKLSETLDNPSGTDGNLNNLNSIFYEHLMLSLQSSLYDDIQLGRFGNVSTGDFFMILNDKLTAMLHIIELGNGFCTFQLRGMEFKGTYCQEKEIEEINRIEYSDDDKYELGKLRIPRFVKIGEILKSRWNSWEVINTAYMLRTYSISLNPANSMFNVWSLRMTLIKYYISACIYYLIKSSSLESWLANEIILNYITSIKPNYVDMDPIFSKRIDEDFDEFRDGISLASFERVYGKWIQQCLSQRITNNETARFDLEDTKIGAPLFNFCFAISTLARRCLTTDPSSISQPYLFLMKYHSLFKGDIRINSTKDEYILADLDILNSVIGKAIRISLRLHQDHFIGEDFEDLSHLYTTLEDYEKQLVVCHEGDPLWRKSILNNVENLLSLRKVSDSSTNESSEHVVVSLTLRYMKFRIIKLNRESVRGLWAGQQQELVFLGNQNPERGSIQQLKTVVRNLVNQSCDGPVGYPIFVSDLTTGYSSPPQNIINTNFLINRKRKRQSQNQSGKN